MKSFNWAACAVLLASAAFTWWALEVSKSLKTTYSIRQFLPESHQLIKNTDEIRAKFEIADSQPLIGVLQFKEGEQSWFSEHNINRLRRVTEKLNSEENVVSVMSLASVQGAVNIEDDIHLGPILEHIPQEKWRDRVINDTLLSPRLISKDERTTLVVVELDIDSPALTGELREKIVDVLLAEFMDASVQVGGIPAIQSTLSALLTRELAWLTLLALVTATFALVVVFRNFFSVIVPLYISLISILSVTASMVFFDTSFTVLSTTLPILITVTVVSMATHTMIRFARDLELSRYHRLFVRKHEMVLQTFRKLFLPNLLTSLTTCVGFLSISTTDSPLIREYSFLVAYAVMVAWALTMLLLPLFLFFIPVPRMRRWTQVGPRWAFTVIKYKKPIFATVAVVTLGFAISGHKLNWAAKLFDDLPRNHEARVSTEKIDKDLGGMIPFQVVLKNDKEEAWYSHARVQKLDQVLQKWREHKHVGNVASFIDYLKAAQYEQGFALPDTDKKIAETVFFYSLSDSRPLNPFITADGREVRVELRLRDVPANELNMLIANVEKDMQEQFAEAEVVIGGLATSAHAINNEMAEALIFGFWTALFFIGVLLVFIFRSVRWTIVAMVPNMVPPLALLGCLALAGTPIKPGIALIFSIALGLAFNNTVYMLSRLRNLYESGNYITPPILKTLYKEGKPCVLSTVALLAGFAAFTASHFQMNQQFGTYMLLSVFFGLVGDLLLLPTFIALFPKLAPLPRSVAASLPLAVTPAAGATAAAESSAPATDMAVADKKVEQESTLSA